MKILHIADEHAKDSALDQVKKSCGEILKTAEIERPDLIVSAGDMFDSRDIRLDTETVKFIFQWISALAKIAPVAVLAGTPSHEGHAIEALRQIPGVWVSTMPEQLCLTKDTDIVPLVTYPFKDIVAILSMVPTPTKQFFQGADEDIAQAMTGIFAGFGAEASEFDCPHILVGHFAIKGAAISDTQVMIGREIEIGRDQIELAKADVVCLGHIHKAQKIGDNIFYPGSIYPTDFGETEDKGFYIHELGRGDLDAKEEYQGSRFITLPTKKLCTAKYDLTEEGAMMTFSALIEGQLVPGSTEGENHKIIIKAYQDEAATIDRQKIEEFYKAAGAESVTIQVINVPRETVRSERLLSLTSLRDKITEMANLSGNTAVASILQKADMLEDMSQEEVIKYVTNTEFNEIPNPGEDLCQL